MHADRTNRVVLTVTALLLLVAGGGVVVLSTGLFATGATGRAISDNVITRTYVEQGSWLWPVTAVVALLVLLLAVRWVIAILFSTDRVSDHQVAGDRSHGATTLAAGALATAVADEVQDHPGVQSCTVRLVENRSGSTPAPSTLVLDVTVAADSDLDEVRDRIESTAIAHARTAMDDPGLPAIVNLSVGRRTADRVH